MNISPQSKYHHIIVIKKNKNWSTSKLVSGNPLFSCFFFLCRGCLFISVVANTEGIYEGCLFFYSCWWPCLHQKPYCYWPWILHTQCSIHSSSSEQSLCKPSCSCCSLTLMSQKMSSLAHHNPQRLNESFPHPPYLVGSENQGLAVVSCMSSSRERGPYSVSAQNPPTYIHTWTINDNQTNYYLLLLLNNLK